VSVLFNVTTKFSAKDQKGVSIVAKKRAEQKHTVRASLEIPGLAKAGSSLRLVLFARGEKLGEITLGRGSLYWYGRYRQKRKRVSWTRFADMMDELAYGKR
jgi:hypothetical protein